MEGGIYVLCSNNKAQGREGQNNLQVSIASQECARNKMVTGALHGSPKNCGVQKFCRQPEAPATRQRPNIGKFRDADEGSAKAEGISNDGDEKGQSQRKHGPSRQGREENIVTVAPQCFGEPQKPSGRQSAEVLVNQLRAARENRRYGETCGQDRKETERDRKTDVDGDSAENAVGKARH